MRIFMTIGRRAAVFALLIVISFGASLLPAHAQTAPAFRMIHMVSPTDGWALVTIPDTRPDRSSPFSGYTYPGTLAYLLHTQDGGQSWQDVSPFTTRSLMEAGGYGCDCSDNGFAGVFFLDASHAWAMTNDAGIPGNQIFDGIGVRVTDSGGQTWEQSHEGLNAPYVLASSFVDPLHGWLLLGGVPDWQSGGEPALLYQTTDGGQQWEFVADDGQYQHLIIDPSANNQPISTVETGVSPMFHRGMAFDTTDSGWILATNYDPGNSVVLHTTNGGETWSPIHLSDGAGSEYRVDECVVREPHVFAPGALSFVASCHDGIGLLYHSANAGATWQRTAIPAHALNLAQPTPLFLLDANTLWSIGCAPQAAECYDPAQANTLYRSRDGGATWNVMGTLPDSFQAISNEMEFAGTQLDFIDAQQGWAITPAGELFATADGGAAWAAVQPVMPNALNAGEAGSA